MYLLLIFFINNQSIKIFELYIYHFAFFILVYSSSYPRKNLALFCFSLSCISVFLSISIYLSSSLLAFFICASRRQFWRSTLLDSETRRDGRASSENPISVTSELKAIGRYRGITRVTAECYREHTAPPVSLSEWSFFEIDAGARCLSNSLF